MPAWWTCGRTRSAVSTAFAPSRCARSTNGSSPTGACGPRASTTSNAVSTPCLEEGAAERGRLERLDDGRWQLRVERTLRPSSSSGGGKGARDAAGWHVCLDNLAAHPRGEETGTESPEACEAVRSEYVEQFGPEAATIGPPQ